MQNIKSEANTKTITNNVNENAWKLAPISCQAFGCGKLQSLEKKIDNLIKDH